MQSEHTQRDWTFKDLARQISVWAEHTDHIALSFAVQHVSDSWYLLVDSPKVWDDVPELTKIAELKMGGVYKIFFEVRCKRYNDHYAGATYCLEIKCEKNYSLSQIKLMLTDLLPRQSPYVSNSKAEEALKRRTKELVNLYVTFCDSECRASHRMA